MDIVLQNKQRLGLTDIVKPGGLLYFHVHEPKINLNHGLILMNKTRTI